MKATFLVSSLIHLRHFLSSYPTNASVLPTENTSIVLSKHISLVWSSVAVCCHVTLCLMILNSCTIHADFHMEWSELCNAWGQGYGQYAWDNLGSKPSSIFKCVFIDLPLYLHGLIHHFNNNDLG